MAAGFVQFQIADVGRDHRVVPALELLLLHEVRQFLAQNCPVGQPQRQALTHHRIDGKEFQFTAQLAVVAALGFLQQVQVLVQFLLGGKRYAIYALEDGILLVSAPVRARRAHQFETLRQFPGVREVRPPAQVGVIALLVERERLVLRQVVDEFHLVRVVRDFLQGFLARHLRAREFQPPPDDVPHDLLDLGQVFFPQRFGQVEVLIPAVLDVRPHPALDGVRRVALRLVELAHRHAHHVAQAVPEEGRGICGVLLGDQRDVRPVRQGRHQIDQFAVGRGRQSVLRQARADGFRRVQGRRALLKFQLFTVGKNNVHKYLFKLAAIGGQPTAVK